MIVIITEKPSVAKDFATYFNATKEDGFFYSADGKELNDEVSITWAFGHLLRNSNIDKLPKKWSMDNLPIFPEEFTYKPNDGSASKQIKTFGKLIGKQDVTVINAGDPAREGELIQRLILDHIGYNYKTFKRFWSSEALTPKVIQMGLANLQPGNNFDSLYSSAKARQHADWIIGINLTQATSLKGGQTYSIGRVQTPVLHLIVSRNNDIVSFKKSFSYYFTILVSQGQEDILLRLEEEISKSEAETRLQIVLDNNSAEILDINTEIKSRKSPNPHSLTSLQQEANKEYGFTASKTLQIAQSLYETKKATSYPRTDSNYLGENTKDQVMSIADDLGTEQQKKLEDLEYIFNNAKLTDHHAIIPLRNVKEGELTENEQKVYYLIKRKFEGIFLLDEKSEHITVTANASEETLIGKSKEILEKGWTKLYSTKTENSTNSSFKNLTKGKLTISKGELVETEKKPPKQFNDATILGKMKKLELGTPATRSEILEKLIKRDYISRNKNKILPTDKGTELISQVKERDFASPEMTSDWEMKLSAIEGNKLSYADFISEVKEFTTKELNNVKTLKIENTFLPPKMVALAKKIIKERNLDTNINNLKTFDELKKFIDSTINKSLGKCSCGGEIKSTPKTYMCSNEKCGRIVWKKSYGTSIPSKDAISLLEGKEVTFKNLKSKAGKKYSATILFNNDNKLSFKK